MEVKRGRRWRMKGMKETSEKAVQVCGADALAKFLPRIQGITFPDSVGLIVIPPPHLHSVLRVH